MEFLHWLSENIYQTFHVSLVCSMYNIVELSPHDEPRKTSRQQKFASKNF